MKPTSLALLSLAVLPLALGAYVRNRAGEAAPPTITVTARDFTLDMPDTLTAGAITLRLVNQGTEFHHIWIARLDEGRTVSDVLEALKSRAGLPAWLKDAGGPNAPRPEGGEASATVMLEPGNYIVACMIPGPDGIPHIMKGMVRPLTVVRSGTAAAAPSADVVMTLRDFNFFLSRPLTPGKSPQDVIAFVEHGVGSPPGLPLGGVSPLAVGGTSYMHVDLAAGRYALICFLPDRKDGKQHFEHGMVREFEVGSALAAN
jgi:hypothetical protein